MLIKMTQCWTIFEKQKPAHGNAVGGYRGWDYSEITR